LASVRSKLVGLLGTGVACGVTALLTWPVHGGFMIWFTVPFLLYWLPRSAYVIWSDAGRRRIQIVKVGLWLSVVATTCGLHWYYARAARAAADGLIESIVAYKARTGNFPDRLQDAGIALDPRTGPWHIGYLVSEEKKHVLIYPTTFTLFEAYIYEFEEGRWVFNPD